MRLRINYIFRRVVRKLSSVYDVFSFVWVSSNVSNLNKESCSWSNNEYAVIGFYAGIPTVLSGLNALVRAVKSGGGIAVSPFLCK